MAFWLLHAADGRCSALGSLLIRSNPVAVHVSDLNPKPRETQFRTTSRSTVAATLGAAPNLSGPLDRIVRVGSGFRTKEYRIQRFRDLGFRDYDEQVFVLGFRHASAGSCDSRLRVVGLRFGVSCLRRSCRDLVDAATAVVAPADDDGGRDTMILILIIMMTMVMAMMMMMMMMMMMATTT